MSAEILSGLFVWLVFFSPAFSQATDPLPSWKDTESKKAIIDFVTRISTSKTRDYVPISERIAVFDNDGTLWVEQPMYVQMAFALDRVKALAPQHPEWKTMEPFASILKGDLKAMASFGEKGAMEVVAATHSGMTTAQFEQVVKDWAAISKHPKTGKLYTEMVYQPMLELLAYLRLNGFKTFIVSGGGVDFMRPWTEKVYGIPPEQVIGSSGKLKLETGENGPVLMKLPEIDLIDDKEGKPVGIQSRIGRRPIFAFGNSDGDQQMLEWVDTGTGPRFMGLVHHTDPDREWSYDRKSSFGKLDKALDEATAKNWTVVDMKLDWNAIYPSDLKDKKTN